MEVRSLIAVLDDPDPEVRGQSVRALGRLGDDRAEIVVALAGLLRDPLNSVRCAAAEALGQIGSGQAVPALVRAVRASSDEVRPFVVSALGRIAAWPDLTVPALVDAVRADPMDFSTVHAFSRMGKDAIAPLVALLKDGRSSVRVAAAAALSGIGREANAASLALADSADDVNAAVRAAAVTALGAIDSRPPTTIAGLAAALEDDVVEVRRSACHALWSFGPAAEAAIPALIATLDKLSGDDAAAPLSAIGEAAIPALVVALASRGRDTRLGAALSLAYMSQRFCGPDVGPAVPALVAALDDKDKEVCLQAAVALRNMGNRVQASVPVRWRAFVSKAFIDLGGS